MYYNNYTYPNYTQHSNNNTNLIFVNGLDNAIHKEGENTRALITDNTIQGLRDQNTAYQLQLSNQAQTANIISQLRPTPIPAYLTCSPYTANNCGYHNGCNYNI